MSLRNKLKHLVHTTPSPSSSTFCTFSRHRQPPPQPPPPPPPPSPPKDPYTLLKQDPIEILSNLWVKTFSNPPQTPFHHLTGFLSKLDLWVLAYQRTCAHVVGTFPPRNSIQSHTLSSLLALQQAVYRREFHWNERLRQCIQAPFDKPISSMSQRKLDVYLNSKKPLFQDRVVQEVLLMILEPIFEPRFSAKSHAFRPNRNAHSVIRTVRSNFAGYLWFIRGDLRDIMGELDVDFVMGLVRKSVLDPKVFNLIRSGLRGRLMNGDDNDDEEEEEKRGGKSRDKKKARTRKKLLKENEPKPDPYWLRTFFEFAPEEAEKVPNYGCIGILSPLLSNIYLNELDQMMEERIVEFFRPCETDSIWKFSIDDGCHNPSWPEFVPASGKEKTRKMDYIRYGGHFLIGIRGPREEAVRIRKEIIEFCSSKYGPRLDNSRIEIEHISRGVQFLDHIIHRRVIYPTLRYTGSGGNVVSEKGVGTLLSVTASIQQCIRQFRKLRFVKGDTDPEPLPCTPMLYSGQAHTNSQMNKLLETMADWYRYADNRKKIVGFCAYVIRSSVAKLYAARYRLKSRAKVYKIAKRDLSSPLREHTNNAAPEYSDLFRMGLVDKIEGIQFSHMSSIPSCDYTPFPRNWVPDHERVLHEYNKLQDPYFFYQLLKSVKRRGPCSPQDKVAEMVWKFKILGVKSYQHTRQEDKGNASHMLMPAS